MKIGLIARYDNSGLGTLSREFAEHLNPEKILLVSNGVFQTFIERYQQYMCKVVPSNRSILREDIAWLLDGIDVLITFETFYNWAVIREAKQRGVKTVLITMFEMTQEILPDYPDLFLCPSKLDYEVFKKYESRSKVEYLPIPVCTNHLVWRQRKKAKTFIHTASHGGVAGRKGTRLFLEAIKKVKTENVNFIIYTWKDLTCDDSRVQVKKQNFRDYWQCWMEGDVLVYPQDFNGICLPVVEALSSGLGIVSTDIFPFNEYLPKELLFLPLGYYQTSVGESLIKVAAAKIDPESIADKIDQIANKDISKYSQYGKTWAEENSWKKLKSKYVELLQNI